MAERGIAYFNPVTRTVMRLTTLPRDNGGREIAIEWTVPPGERLAAAPHYHAGPVATFVERFDVLSGSASCRIGILTRSTGTPGSFEVPANVVHTHPVNEGAEPLIVLQTVRLPQPDLDVLIRLQRFFETSVALAQQGKSDRDGNFGDLPQRVLTMHETLIDPTFLPALPQGLQKAAFALGAILARRLGYRAHYEPVPSRHDETGQESPDVGEA